MAIYHYKQSPLIDRIEVKSPRPGIAQATIIAKDGIAAEQLDELRQKLGAKNFSTMMDTKDGHAIIQVRGLKDGKSLLTELGKLGLTQGGMEKETTAADKKKISFREKVRGKSLFLSAIFYDIGNISLLVSGVQRGRHNPGGKFTSKDVSELMTGVAFSVGDVVMTAYGSDKGDEELNAAAKGLKRHLHQKGIEVPKGDALNPDSLHKSGTVKATDRWLRKHIIHIKCLAEFAGGLFMMHAGLKRDAKNKFNEGKLIAGFLISTGWLATFLLDKPHGEHIFDRDDSPSSTTIAEKMANNPRGWIARPLAMGNNVANLWGVYDPKNGERARFGNEARDAQSNFRTNPTSANRAHMDYTKIKQHDYNWNVLTACSFLVAHTLFGISGSKRPAETEDDKTMMNDMVLMAANVLAKQPEAVRKASLEETSDYISKLAGIEMTKSQVHDAIASKVEALTHSTWANRVQQPASSDKGQSVTV